jgi:hypothetical protein
MWRGSRIYSHEDEGIRESSQSEYHKKGELMCCLSVLAILACPFI